MTDLTVEPDEIDIDAEFKEDEEFERNEPLDLTGDERRLVTQPYDLSVSSLVDDIDAGRLLLRMDYQRSYIWDDAKASRLIESLLLNVPIPVCYFAENEDGGLEIFLRASVTAPDGSVAIRLSAIGPISDSDGVGRRLAADLLAGGAQMMMETPR